MLNGETGWLPSGNLKGWEILVILALLVAAVRRIFKSEVQAMHDDDDAATPQRPVAPATTPPALESRPATVGHPTVRAAEPAERVQPEGHVQPKTRER